MAAATIATLAFFVALLAAMLVYLWLSIRPRTFELAPSDSDVPDFVHASIAAARTEAGNLSGGTGEQHPRRRT